MRHTFRDHQNWLLLSVLAAVTFAAAMFSVPARAQDGSELTGNWRVPGYEQQRYRMSDQCKARTRTDVEPIGESGVEVFDCNDPKHAAVKQRIEAFVRAVNPIYRRQGHPLYSETISGLCAVVRQSQTEETQDVCNPSPDLRSGPIVGLPVIWNIRPSRDRDWAYVGDSYSPSSGYGAISCFKRPQGGRLLTKGCRRWTVELPLIGSEPCDCGCSMVVCDQYIWQRK